MERVFKDCGSFFLCRSHLNSLQELEFLDACLRGSKQFKFLDVCLSGSKQFKFLDACLRGSKLLKLLDACLSRSKLLELLETSLMERMAIPLGAVPLRRMACAIAGFAVGYLAFSLLGLSEENLRETYRPVRETLVSGLTALVERAVASLSQTPGTTGAAPRPPEKDVLPERAPAAPQPPGQPPAPMSTATPP